MRSSLLALALLLAGCGHPPPPAPPTYAELVAAGRANQKVEQELETADWRRGVEQAWKDYRAEVAEERNWEFMRANREVRLARGHAQELERQLQELDAIRSQARREGWDGTVYYQHRIEQVVRRFQGR